MSYLSISFTHKNTDIQTREKIAFSNESSVETFLKSVKADESIDEVVLLSTCNRVEIMTTSLNIKQSKEKIFQILAKYSGLDYENLLERADIYDNTSAIHHLFSVASALDSLVIGETQIVGQLRDAFRLSLAKGYCGKSISKAMNYAFKCAANVRTETSLGTGSVSVASTAVAKAKDIIQNTSGVKALVIGAGEMSELTMKHLNKAGFDIVLTSRDIKKAQMLVDTFDFEVSVEPYEDLEKLLNEIPIMITATAAPYPIIKESMVKNCSFGRHWFDIAVPRDIEEIESSNLKIYAVDDLQEIVNSNMTLRAEQAKRAYQIVNQESEEFFKWLKSLEVEPVVKHLYTKADDVIEKKLQNAIKKGFVKAEDEENIKKLCQTVLNEFLHEPTTRLKKISKDVECDIILGTVQSVFGLESKSNSIQKCDHAIKFNN
ncbi:glutamyl-tRNA reductase [uncultured Arcobacter sp.]|uniref:glutamyl-tRNA reductase n=1 Tax=uncultured Arcobacter sp. TaxID=165434 RepID=UPI002633364A|nr:glutamyl-tRNA reductase [uncultured Arcobacter sp.]